MSVHQRSSAPLSADRPGAEGRAKDLAWDAIRVALDAEGHARVPALLERGECEAIAGLYADHDRFRSRVVMARHGYGQGEYRYFGYPLPPLVEELRTTLYPPLARIANGWAERLREQTRFPEVHARYIERCHADGQTRPTPLVLRYEEGDFNCLHQDVYGAHLFPLQVAILLSAPGRDFEGGEFVLTEQRPRQQSRVAVVPLEQGDAVVFAVRERPVEGRRGVHRVQMRHGVSRIRAGLRFTLGIIFHDAA